jgi:hypothetical protein
MKNILSVSVVIGAALMSGHMERARSAEQATQPPPDYYGVLGVKSHDDPEKDAAYSCPQGAPTKASAAALQSADWDQNKLACAADAWFALSEASPKDRDTAFHALMATTEYINHENYFWGTDLLGVRHREDSLRISRAQKQGDVLEAKLATLSDAGADILAARALYKLSVIEHMGGNREHQIKESRVAMQLLNEAVTQDRKALNGNALWELARLYNRLPDFAGGDTDKGHQLLAEALLQTPGSPELILYAANVAAQDGNMADAKSKLSAMLALTARPGTLQAFADTLLGAQGLATRLGESDLQNQLAKKRSAFLAKNRQLLTRVQGAALGHGGVNPVTGEE